jgi:hypothetical protein
MAAPVKADAATMAALRAQEQATARSLVRTEAEGYRELSRAIKRETQRVVASIAMIDPTVPDEDVQARAMAEVDSSSDHLAKALLAILLLLRSRSRGAGRLALESALGIKLLGGIYHGPVDVARARAAANALANQWAALALAAIVTVQGAADVARAVGRTYDTMTGRASRTAATETVSAVNDELRRAATDLERETGRQLMRVWSAFLDNRVCPECAIRHGKMVPNGIAFDGEPPLHPLCRCIILYLWKRPD